ncbi:acetyl-CoA C-acetyltransferase [Gammaproteobacteria bacterium]|nr:acetyl-CoA C-acetyltransferase [Gammaproteobacteria bacterium]MDA8925456.1 acetyl-CoA C-acetyltransferase [Gammaproteobacteria bacterium]MDA9049025.1 acetyl-CoA C-acetyltransferase [Gammaproteobacteria bacterium]MDA9153966.1 acetyl-CoA C-acetyltransferase [Gammaproteobacteria bacterium]MDA9340878.1 acetyl-CoA C-acetyltransferase [Gammaproteobacteria bacterium]|tara:strand:- start:132 stop:1313 length:1182 start_codon:yes stop_codon:yes gene_type:complete
MSNNNAYIVSAVRTAGGKKNGSLSQWHPADLGAKVLDELVLQTGIDPALVDDVIFGCVDQVGAQSGNVARNAILASTLPESVPGTSVDRQCGSSQQAIHFAIQAVMSGTQDVVIGGGVEIMSMVPIGASIKDGYEAGHGLPFDSEGMKARYPGVFFSQFTGAEMMAQKWNLSREDLDNFAFSSHQKAIAAVEGKYFDREILPVQARNAEGKTDIIYNDEGIRYDASLEALAGLKTVTEGGVITAGNASQITDGAAAVMVCNDAGLKKIKTDPRARIVAISVVGDDPIMMLGAPIPASHKALKAAGLNIQDIDLYEINEAFAPVPLSWAIELKADINKLNVNGGAMALGHPLGATGAKLMTTLLHELERSGGKYGLQAICEGGGTANATIIEKL